MNLLLLRKKYSRQANLAVSKSTSSASPIGKASVSLRKDSSAIVDGYEFLIFLLLLSVFSCLIVRLWG